MSAEVKIKEENAVWETVSVVLQALVLALILRTFLFQPFNIPSGSMKPTLLVGDYIFVSKFSYGFSRYSLPFGPNIFSGRIWGSDPERGDVVVFKYPPDPSKDYIKRVVGLPGDKIQMKNGVLFVNEKQIAKAPDGKFTEMLNGREYSVPQFKETLPNGVVHHTLDTDPNARGADNTEVFEVPDGKYFFIGDNRDGSADSRFDVGYVPAENLVGKAQVIFMSLDNGAAGWQVWKWPTSMRWDRIFKGI